MVWRHLNSDPQAHYPVTLTWTPTDPLAVTVTFHGDKPAVWTIARDLLAEGLLHGCGAGDVRVYPHHAWGEVEIILSSHNGVADLACDLGQLDDFLASTFQVIPGGEEIVNFDTELAELLRREAA